MKFKLYSLLLLFTFLSFSCTSEFGKDTVIGQWKVSDLKVNMENVPAELIKNAEILSLATSYEIRPDLSYTMTIAKNELENTRIQTGQLKLGLKSQRLRFTIDTLKFEKNNSWQTISKEEHNKPLFQSTTMKLEKHSRNMLVLAQERPGGLLYYTLERIK